MINYQCRICPHCHDDHLESQMCTPKSDKPFTPSPDDKSHIAEQYRAIIAERDRMKALLEEAADWVCVHTEAVAMWKELKGARREWCSDCDNYLRSERDATLPERLRAALTHSPSDAREPDETGGV